MSDEWILGTQEVACGYDRTETSRAPVVAYRHASAPGLAVTAGVGGETGRWVVSAACGWALRTFDTIDEAKRVALAVALTTDWTRSAEEIIADRETIRPAVAAALKAVA